jgi:transposase
VPELRYQAVLAVISDGLSVSQVAQKVGVSRQTLHTWLARYEAQGLGWWIGRIGRCRVRIRCRRRWICAVSARKPPPVATSACG